MTTAFAASPAGEARQKREIEYPEQMDAARRLTLDWCQHLTPAEFLLVSWIMGNTVFRGWRSGVYSLPQICNGVPNRETGGMWAKGTGLSNSGVRKMTAALRKRGLLHTEITPRGTRFTVVLSWNPATGRAEKDNVVALNLPRALRRTATKPAEEVKANDWDSSEEERPLLSGGGDRYSVPGGTATQCRPSKALPTNSLFTKGEDYETDAARRLVLPEFQNRVRPAPPAGGLDEHRHNAGNKEPTPH
ncbi:hypothetical protein, partial [Methylobacterium sp. WL19]|uniref:hypothetical protein n=1 Tax=Methylobacterium sp. WL19 TaxID=2603896 RepID=UPI001AEEB602